MARSGAAGVSLSVTSKDLYNLSDTVETYYANSWVVGFQLYLDEALTEEAGITGTFRTEDYVAYYVSSGVITHVGNSLVVEGLGFDETTSNTCFGDTHTTKWFSVVTNKWYSQPIEHAYFLMNGEFIEDGYAVVYNNGEIESSAWACPWPDNIYSNCYDAQYLENQDTTFYSQPGSPLNTWGTGTSIYGDSDLTMEAPDGTYYINRDGVAKSFSIVSGEIITNLTDCDLPMSTDWWTTPNSYFNSDMPAALLWTYGSTGFQSGVFVYKDPQLSTLADPGYYYLNSGQYFVINMSGQLANIEAYPGKLYGFTGCDQTWEQIIFTVGSVILGAIVFVDVNNNVPSLWNLYTGQFVYGGILYNTNSSGIIYAETPCGS